MSKIDKTTGKIQNALNSDIVQGTANTATNLAGTVITAAQRAAGDVKTPMYIRDLYTNGFNSVKSVYAPTSLSRAFDEPTYLTFRVEFDFDDTDSEINIMASTKMSSDCYQCYATKNLYYDTLPNAFLMNDENNNNRYSALGYLKNNVGDFYRYHLLKGFIKRLKDIQNVYPYYFKSISGLSTLMNISHAEGIRVKDAAIEISCEEAIDMRITQLIQTYRAIVWDDVYQRWILPDMMRFFRMKIYISEIRLFHELRGLYTKEKGKYYFSKDNLNVTYRPDKVANIIGGVSNAINTATALSARFLGTESTMTGILGSVDAGVETLGGLSGKVSNEFMKLADNAVNMLMPTIMIDCRQCEFDITNNFEYLSQLSSFKDKTIEPKLKIKIGEVYSKQSYSLSSSIDDNLKDTNHYMHFISDEYALKSYQSEDNLKNDINHLYDDGELNKSRFNTKGGLNGSNLINDMTSDKLTYYTNQKSPNEADNIGYITSMVSDSIYNVANAASSTINPTNTDREIISNLKDIYGKNPNSRIGISDKIYSDSTETNSSIGENPYESEVVQTTDAYPLNPYDDDNQNTATQHEGNPYNDDTYEVPHIPHSNPYVDDPNPTPINAEENPYDDETYTYYSNEANPYDDDQNPTPINTEGNPYNDETYEYHSTEANLYDDERYEFISKETNPYIGITYSSSIPKPEKISGIDHVEMEISNNPYFGIKTEEKEFELSNPYSNEKEDKKEVSFENIYKDLEESLKEKSNLLKTLWVNIYNNDIVKGIQLTEDAKQKISLENFYGVLNVLEESGAVNDPQMASLIYNTKEQIKERYGNIYEEKRSNDE